MTLLSVPDGSRVQLRLPTAGRLGVVPLDRALEAAISRVSNRCTDLHRTFGLELQAAAIHTNDAASARVFARLAARPAFEAAVLPYWRKLQLDRPDRQSLHELARALAGQNVDPAFGVMRTSAKRDGSYVVYASSTERLEWADRLELGSTGAACPLASALFAYTVTIIAHPFTDGNGRVARALLHGRLAAGGLIASPCIPLAPAFYRGREKLAEAMRAAGQDDDVEAALRMMSALLWDAVADADSLLTDAGRR